MKQKQIHPFGSMLEALTYPALFLVVIWLIQIIQIFTSHSFVDWGVQPRNLGSLKGILFMPLIHSPRDWQHILNNSAPAFLLMASVIYFYRNIALKIILLSWVLSGIGVWLFATNPNSFHIGFSGVIYALAAFIFFSGYQRSYLPLQAMSLFVAFLYGSMVWGIFPVKESVSWEGHLSGLFVGAFLSIFYLKKGPEAPKYQYEIEKELGLEPPDLEGMYWAKVNELEERQRMLTQQNEENQTKSTPPLIIQYHYKPTQPPLSSDQADETGGQ